MAFIQLPTQDTKVLSLSSTWETPTTADHFEPGKKMDPNKLERTVIIGNIFSDHDINLKFNETNNSKTLGMNQSLLINVQYKRKLPGQWGTVHRGNKEQTSRKQELEPRLERNSNREQRSPSQGDGKIQVKAGHEGQAWNRSQHPGGWGRRVATSSKLAWVAHQVLESLGYRVGPCLREQEQSKTLKIHDENTKKENRKNIVIFPLKISIKFLIFWKDWQKKKTKY
jgi:hypothetical protein